jgi:hypothetical protein
MLLFSLEDANEVENASKVGACAGSFLCSTSTFSYHRLLTPHNFHHLTFDAQASPAFASGSLGALDAIPAHPPTVLGRTVRVRQCRGMSTANEWDDSWLTPHLFDQGLGTVQTAPSAAAAVAWRTADLPVASQSGKHSETFSSMHH